VGLAYVVAVAVGAVWLWRGPDTQHLWLDGLIADTLATLVIFFISADQGLFSIPSGNAIHEWVHDGRHLLGYPCH